MIVVIIAIRLIVIVIIIIIVIVVIVIIIVVIIIIISWPFWFVCPCVFHAALSARLFARLYFACVAVCLPALVFVFCLIISSDNTNIIIYHSNVIIITIIM